MQKNWITEITIENYRAFGKKEAITIPEGSHLLIYGENGSGKSSIYNALKDFFSSSVNNIDFKLNKFEQKKGNINGIIKLKIEKVGSNPPDIKYFFLKQPYTGSTSKQPIIILSNKVKGFLDYKHMLKAHALEVPDGNKPNVFDLIIKDLLGEHKIADPKGGATTVELFEAYNSIKKTLLNNPKHSHKYKNAEEERKKINVEIKILLRAVFQNVNDFLKNYFNNKIDVDVVFSDIKIEKPFKYKKKIIVENLNLKIKYAGEEIEFYQTFLNEARLSSLAVCIYLASIKVFNPSDDRLKVLYLDDVFIGLDTSNRFPLLEIIKDEFIDSGFQIFMSTYDKEWFELSRQWFTTKSKVKAIELYIEDDGNPNTPDFPIVHSFKSNIKRAEDYFKGKDYAAAANYIRKECELIVKDLLPKTYQFDNSGNIIEKFEDLLNQLKKFFDESNLVPPNDLIDSIKIYRKALLNPASHSDITSPIFKKEVQTAFEIITKLQSLVKVDRKLIAEKGQTIIYENKAAKYQVELELATNLWKVVNPKGNTFSKCKFYIKNWAWNGKLNIDHTGKPMPKTQFDAFCEDERNIDEIFSIINKSTKIPIPANPFKELKIGATGTLIELL